MPTDRINGVRIHWDRCGDTGDPVVLVHGSWADGRSWETVTPALSQSLRLLTYDRRGHSRSERPTAQGSIREDVADLAALMEGIGHRPAHVVGNSFGGSIALRLAAERPGLVRSVIVHEPPLLGLLKDDADAAPTLAGVRQHLAAVAAMIADGEATAGAHRFVDTVAFGPGTWDVLSPELRATFVTNAPTFLDEVNDPDAFEIDLGALRRLRTPVLLTLGDQSPSFFPRVVRRLAAAIPKARTQTIAGAGHVPHLTHPDEFAGTVSRFIAEAA
jgi:pimeloyl-ACP methyl ester carboxylesterase